ncbi:LysM peptidoglycan-binding domain-containing protein [Thermohalobacter berrensis]|uniref:LysM domain-containing protein n=1 Tax=Thermohalobacter berrensis TaxID=99594 RepID=A0A419TAK5_9FIRM|nr:LysM peptidoglycan-binding domain-containing protein [Thermohalobacter berrensis]RKD34508.1 hypothetical protein BET03_01365 [Thermohalobacter berrensis]
MLKIKNNFRFACFITILTLIIISILGVMSSLEKVYSSGYTEFIEVKVKRGDTLWNIAKKNNPNNDDVRKIVHKIMKLNDMESAEIFPGDVLKVPLK